MICDISCHMLKYCGGSVKTGQQLCISHYFTFINLFPIYKQSKMCTQQGDITTLATLYK